MPDAGDSVALDKEDYFYDYDRADTSREWFVSKKSKRGDSSLGLPTRFENDGSNDGRAKVDKISRSEKKCTCCAVDHADVKDSPFLTGMNHPRLQTPPKKRRKVDHGRRELKDPPNAFSVSASTEQRVDSTLDTKRESCNIAPKAPAAVLAIDTKDEDARISPPEKPFKVAPVDLRSEKNDEHGEASGRG